jgi:hypothetical protein
MVALRVGLVVCNGFTHAHDTVNMIDLGIDTDPYLDFSKPYVGPYMDLSRMSVRYVAFCWTGDDEMPLYLTDYAMTGVHSNMAALLLDGLGQGDSYNRGACRCVRQPL